LVIIGGKFKGRHFLPVKERGVRPTAARVREAIFDILSDQVQEAVVLDLFAGTGALGLEAISRGAVYAVFIDQNKKMLSQIAQSIHLFDLEKQSKLIRWDITKNLNCIKKSPSLISSLHSGENENMYKVKDFNLVFIDPPYNQGLIEATLGHLNNSRALSQRAVVVIEHDKFESIPNDPMPYEITNQRRYGQTMVSFLDYIL